MIMDVLAQAAASLVVVVHLGVLAFIVFGGFLALRWFSLIWLSVVATAWSIWVTLAERGCPLTALEKELWAAGGRASYEGSFIAHYLHDVLFPAEYEMVAWLLATGIALSSYVLVLTRRRAARREPAALAGTPG